MLSTSASDVVISDLKMIVGMHAYMRSGGTLRTVFWEQGMIRNRDCLQWSFLVCILQLWFLRNQANGRFIRGPLGSLILTSRLIFLLARGQISIHSFNLGPFLTNRSLKGA